jgi:GNAT superfamily N-acetyltransferase
LILLHLDDDWLPRLAELDRSESPSGSYLLQSGELRRSEAVAELTTWPAGELAERTEHLRRCLEGDGLAMGAQARGRLVAFAGMTGPLPGVYRGWRVLAHCFTDKAWRGKGLGSALLRALSREAVRRGSEKLYIPSLPLAGSVDFWTRRGALLLPAPPEGWQPLTEGEIPLVLSLEAL